MLERERESMAADNERPEMVARCGHVDPMGYFAGTVCGKCARANHRAVVGGRSVGRKGR